MAGERPVPSEQRFVSRIVVGNKPEIPNPQDAALLQNLQRLGLHVNNVRSGKLFEVVHVAESANQAQATAEQMAVNPLSNPVYEEVRSTETRVAPPVETIEVSNENL